MEKSARTREREREREREKVEEYTKRKEGCERDGRWPFGRRGQNAEAADRGWSVRADSSADTRSRTSITRRQASLV